MCGRCLRSSSGSLCRLQNAVHSEANESRNGSSLTLHLCNDQLEERHVTGKANPISRNRTCFIECCRIAIEVGTHSPWVSRLLHAFGHEVIVANAWQVKLTSESSRKDDRLRPDAGPIDRVDPQLLRLIRHRSEKAQGDLMVIRVRSALVEARTGLINTTRGLVKSRGERLPICDSDQMGIERTELLPAELQQVLEPLLKQVVSLTEKIKELDRRVEQIAGKTIRKPDSCSQVKGVGPLISLTLVLTLEDKARFQKSRDVGCYVGLRPRRSESGESQPQLRIAYTRWLSHRRARTRAAYFNLPDPTRCRKCRNRIRLSPT